MPIKSGRLFLIVPIVLGGSQITFLPTYAAEKNVGQEDSATTSLSPVAQSLSPVNTATDFQTFNSNFHQPGGNQPSSEAMHQVTSVSQLTDVQPTDWAFQALQSLVERYGCIVGYPNRTYRGNQAISRYEFAAGLNACMDKIQELLSATTADLVRPNDLVALQKMQEEFAAELATIRGRVEALEVRIATLEKQPFSTTTKLLGEVVFSVFDAFGGAAGDRTQTALQYRASLNLVSSFTGQDRLIVGLKTGNTPILATRGVGFVLPGTTVSGITFPSSEGTLSSQFAAIFNNTLNLTTLEYQFPVSDRLRVYVGAANELYNQFTDTLNPYFDDNDGGRGAISAFGQRNPLYRLGAGPGVGIKYALSDQLTFSGGYLSSFVRGAADPTQGLFNASYGALAQLTWRPSKTFGIAATYLHSYYTPGRFGFNNLGLTLTGTAVANTLAGQVAITDILGVGPFNGPPVVASSYGGQISFQPNPNFVINGWFGATYARLVDKGDGQILTYALNIGFPNLGKPGNFLGFVFGAEPYLTRFEGGNPKSFRVDLPFHIEAFYRWQVNDHIAITPGLIWLTAPNQDNRNPDTIIGIVRTTFNF